MNRFLENSNKIGHNLKKVNFYEGNIQYLVNIRNLEVKDFLSYLKTDRCDDRTVKSKVHDTIYRLAKNTNELC